ncbi:lipopolysaccharide heptosyltransferase I [Methylibium sp.]|uniref:lipopolysaccharide heptosyltransferase I n=1 Tax=Methylibium sp. TaxID=2067992 RepID=UPI003D0C2059
MRVLIVRLSSLGDVVHAAPVLGDLHRAHPGAQVDWVVEEAFVPLARSLAGIERIVPFALRRWKKSLGAAWPEWTEFWRSLRSVRYDAVLDLQGLVKSALVTRAAVLAPGGRRYGLANRTDGAAYEPLARLAYDVALAMPPRIHVVDRSRELAARALGYAVEGEPVVPWRPPPLDPQDARWADPRDVLLVHGSAKLVKLLPTAFWSELGRRLVARGAQPLLAWGTADERLRAEAIQREIGGSSAVLPRLPLDRLAAVMLRMGGSIGLDTGLSHMAATLGRPTVQIFIEDKAWRAAAYWELRTAVVQASEVALPTVEQVLQAWERVA